MCVCVCVCMYMYKLNIYYVSIPTHIKFMLVYVCKVIIVYELIIFLQALLYTIGKCRHV